jgi:hypothetical protein
MNPSDCVTRLTTVIRWKEIKPQDGVKCQGKEEEEEEENKSLQ